MIIFVPYADFKQSAACLDNYMLRKQCILVARLLKHLSWHSAEIDDTRPCLSSMWCKYPGALAHYGLTLAQEALNRGYINIPFFQIAAYKFPYKIPKWIGWEPLHNSYKAGLMRFDEKRRTCEGFRQLLTRRRLSNRRRRNQFISVKEFLITEFGINIHNEFDSWCIRDLQHYLGGHRIHLRGNYYSNFITSLEQQNIYIPLVWPYHYVEEDPNYERDARRHPRPSRRHTRTMSRARCEEISRTCNG